MKFETKIKLNLLKKYFDQGYGLTSFAKYFIAVLGIGNAIINKSLSEIIIGGIIYAVLCFIIGWMWFKYRWYEADIEITNRFNPFVKAMRKTKLLNSSVSKKKQGK